MKVSIFPKASVTVPQGQLLFDQYLEDIKEGKWQDVVIKARREKAKSKDAYKAYKESVPAVTASGVFKYRNSDPANMVEHSGILAIDIDEKGNEDGIPRDELAADFYTYAMHSSLSGDGVVIYVKIDSKRHLDSFFALEKYYANTYKVVIDTLCKNVDRLRFISFDPDLVKNANAKTFKAYLPKKKVQPSSFAHVSTTKDFEHCVKQLVNRGIDITCDYHDWINLGFSIASEFGENGRSYFHELSAINSSYDYQKCDKKYSNLLRNGKSVSISTFYYMCKNAGIETKTKRTIAIESVAKMQRRLVGKNGGHKDNVSAINSTVKILSDIDGIEGGDVTQVVEQVMKMRNDQIASNNSKDLVEDVRQFLRGYNLKFNEITRSIELNGKDITDRDLNTIYISALEVLSNNKKQVSKDILFSMIDSENTHSYNPFFDFFEQNKDRKTEGHMLELLSCFDLGNYQDKSQANRDMTVFVEKWMLSVIASMHGTYSVMCLVLCGAQNIGKTRFFRHLLPEELRNFYAESKLDEGKDAELLMCKKLIICDDEFGGKSKQDAKKFKELISKQVFSIRKPYGRVSEDLPRYAVLCGTSNEEEVLNDPTGNRRILPINLKGFNWERYQKIDKTALWMEMYRYYKTFGDAWMLTKDDIKRLNEFTVSNEQPSQEEEALFMFYRKPKEGERIEEYSNTEIRTTIEMGTRLKISAHKLGLAMKKLNIGQEHKKVNGRTTRLYKLIKVTEFG
jgi:predicted P-loop ATPase